jgi:hypothetical protein
MLFTGHRIKRREIDKYFNDVYLFGLELHNRFKRFGLPYSGGWAEQPEYLIKIIEIFERVYMQYSEQQRKKAVRRGGS